ncbi:hypothetical protein [Nitrosospira sp. Nsp11]|uniref:hypothetical protein n=1 Tax=Nitrosospira sp. Nsp11 TaxID=1855338 RepID=UPI001160A62D|nr:hypothetical protein [Nitrosospira sp. Nsp11]
MDILAKRLKTKAFQSELTDGFVLDRVRDEFVEARFVERIEYDDTVTDPFGAEVVFHRVEYRQCEFRATKDGPGLELLDAPRSIQTMVSRLLEISDFSLAINPVSVDVLAWAVAVQKHLSTPGMVDSLQISDLSLNLGITVNAVVKGSSDVLEATTILIGGRKHTIEKLQLTLPGAKQSRMILTNAAGVKLHKGAPDQVLDAIRLALRNLILRSNKKPISRFA